MTKNQNLLALKQSEKIDFLARSWMGVIDFDGIEITSDKNRWARDSSNVVLPKIHKLTRNISAVYDNGKQLDEKLEISAFIGKQPIKGSIYILECLESEENKDCKSYMFGTEFIPLIKAINNFMIPNFDKKAMQICCLNVPF